MLRARPRRKAPVAFSSEPILHLQAADTFELTGVRRHYRRAGRISVSSDHQIVAADRLSGVLQPRADSAVFGIGGNVKRQYVHLAEQVFDGPKQPFRAALCTSVVQLGCNDDASADVVLANLGDSLRGSTLRVPDQV